MNRSPAARGARARARRARVRAVAARAARGPRAAQRARRACAHAGDGVRRAHARAAAHGRPMTAIQQSSSSSSSGIVDPAFKKTATSLLVREPATTMILRVIISLNIINRFHREKHVIVIFYFCRFPALFCR